MAHLLEKTRKITSILKRSEEQMQDELPYNAITRQLADIIDCNACIVNSKGRLLGYFMRYKTNTDRVEQFFQTKTFPDASAYGKLTNAVDSFTIPMAFFHKILL